MSSLLTKSAIGTEVMSWLRYVPGWLSAGYPAISHSTHLELPEPFLTIVCLLLAERHIDQCPIIRLDGLES